MIHNGVHYFSNFSDQQLYQHNLEDPEPTQLTDSEGLRFADGCIDPKRNRIIYVLEDHRVSGEPENMIGAVDLDGGGITILAKGMIFMPRQ